MRSASLKLRGGNFSVWSDMQPEENSRMSGRRRQTDLCFRNGRICASDGMTKSAVMAVIRMPNDRTRPVLNMTGCLEASRAPVVRIVVRADSSMAVGMDDDGCRAWWRAKMP